MTTNHSSRRPAKYWLWIWIGLVLGITLATLSAIMLNLQAVEKNRSNMAKALTLYFDDDSLNYILRHDDFFRRKIIIIGALVINGIFSIGIVTLFFMLFKTYQALRWEEKTKSEMQRAIAHDANHYLQLIILNNDLLLEKLETGQSLSLPAETKKIKAVQENSEALSRLLANLVNNEDLSRGLIKLFQKQFDLVDLIRTMLNSFAERFSEKSIRIRFDPAEPLLAVWADADLVRQVVLNLLHNAYKFSPAESQIDIRLQKESQQVITFIQDQGPGIAPEHQQIIFESFVSLDPQHGTGLGLSNARRFIELMGGQLGIHASQLGQGTTFFFTLPRSRL